MKFYTTIGIFVIALGITLNILMLGIWQAIIQLISQGSIYVIYLLPVGIASLSLVGLGIVLLTGFPFSKPRESEPHHKAKFSTGWEGQN